MVRLLRGWSGSDDRRRLVRCLYLDVRSFGARVVSIVSAEREQAFGASLVELLGLRRRSDGKVLLDEKLSRKIRRRRVKTDLGLGRAVLRAVKDDVVDLEMKLAIVGLLDALEPHPTMRSSLGNDLRDAVFEARVAIRDPEALRELAARQVLDDFEEEV